MSSIAERLARVHARIHAAATAAGREATDIRLLAVSKTRPTADVEAALAAGQQTFGESYVQDALPKIAAIGGRAEWHFIGPVQSNKTRAIAEHFDWVQSVDRLKIARRLSEQRPPGRPPLQICLQVNVSRDPAKAGVDPDQTGELARAVADLPNLRLRGLMTIPARCEDPDRQREPFRRLRELYETLQTQGLALDTLSMGMSADLEAAIAEGATVVRIGTAIFGPRN